MQGKTFISAQYKMSEKTIKFGHVVVNKKEFHASKKKCFTFSKYRKNSCI